MNKELELVKLGEKHYLKLRVVENEYTITIEFFGKMILPPDEEEKWRTICWYNKHTKNIHATPIGINIELYSKIISFFNKEDNNE